MSFEAASLYVVLSMSLKTSRANRYDPFCISNPVFRSYRILAESSLTIRDVYISFKHVALPEVLQVSQRFCLKLQPWYGHL